LTDEYKKDAIRTCHPHWHRQRTHQIKQPQTLSLFFSLASPLIRAGSEEAIAGPSKP